MTPDTDRSSTPGSVIRDARLVYGAALVEDQLTFVECVDEDAFAETGYEATLYTAFNSIGADLVEFVDEAADERTEAAVSTTVTDDAPRVTAFDRAASIVADARAYYVLAHTGEHDWKRLWNADPSAFDGSDDAASSREGRYAVASALVDEAKERIADLPDTVDAGDVDLITWS